MRLVSSSSNGCSDSTSQRIQFNPLPRADFASASPIGCAPFNLILTGKSVYSDQYRWYVNDRLVSTDAVPEIILEDPDASYSVKLVTANIYGCVEDSIVRNFSTYPSPTASFEVLETISCNGKLDIRITNTSQGAVSYQWDFGDGSALQSGMAPGHTYGRPGIFKLLLSASNGTCIDTSSVLIKISAPPNAGFIALNREGCTSVSVAFKNISVNTTNYLWDFGDGTYSTEREPVHTYTYLNSPFSVTLVAYGDYGCIDTVRMADYITVTAPPRALFSVLPDTVISIPDFSFDFKNESIGLPIKFFWNFGDGKLSQIENPSHTYTGVGKYPVRLIVENEEGCRDTLFRTVEVLDVPGYLYVQNAFEPDNVNIKVKEFKPTGFGMTKYSLRIFNKWGQLIWQTDKLNELGEPLEGWDGKVDGVDVQQGVYVWDISALFINGTEWKGMKYEKGPLRKSGPVHLIR